MATKLACALDAPAGATCDEVTACWRAPEGAKPSCDGDVVTGVRTGRGNLQVHCSLFGMHCFEGPFGPLCAEEPCSPGETAACKGEVASNCVLGVRTLTNCAPGAACGVGPNGSIDCYGKGGECQDGEARCDGDAAVNCVRSFPDVRREVATSCADWGMGCTVLPAGVLPSKAVCIPKATECDPKAFRARCVGGDLEVCVAGTLTKVSCGDCQPSGGFEGEATCAAW